MYKPRVFSSNPEQALLHYFHADLQAWINKVWQLKNSILAEAKTDEDSACWMIYGLYGQAGGSSQFDPSEMQRFTNRFLKIMTRYRYPLHTGVSQSSAGHYALQGQNPWDAFYHIEPNKCNYGAIKKRIYIHTKEPTVKGMLVLAAIVHMLETCDGLEKVKIAGPGEKSRLDTIVVYLQDKPTAINAVLVALQNPALADCFEAGLPLGVDEKSVGVGVADEPPAIGVTRKGEESEQSFGWFYSGTLLVALVSTPNSKIAFMESVLNLFELAKIDPKNPASLSEARKLENLKFFRTHK